MAAGTDERVIDARDRYLSANGLSIGQYSESWFDFRLGPVVLHLPNPPQRRASVRHHDLHHVATGFESTWRGEVWISAWEVGAGLGGRWIAWAICVPLFLAGLVVMPRSTWRAFAFGRRCKSLFRAAREPGCEYDELLTASVGELRRRIGLPQDGVAHRV